MKRRPHGHRAVREKRPGDLVVRGALCVRELDHECHRVFFLEFRPRRKPRERKRQIPPWAFDQALSLIHI